MHVIIGPNYLAMRNLYISSKAEFRIWNFLFVFKGSQVNTPIQNGRNALHIAVQAGKLEVMKYLVSKGADVNVSY